MREQRTYLHILSCYLYLPICILIFLCGHIYYIPTISRGFGFNLKLSNITYELFLLLNIAFDGHFFSSISIQIKPIRVNTIRVLVSY